MNIQISTETLDSFLGIGYTRRTDRVAKIFDYFCTQKTEPTAEGAYVIFRRVFNLIENHFYQHHFQIKNTYNLNDAALKSMWATESVKQSFDCKEVFYSDYLAHTVLVSKTGALGIYLIDLKSPGEVEQYRNATPVFLRRDSRTRDVFGRL